MFSAQPKPCIGAFAALALAVLLGAGQPGPANAGDTSVTVNISITIGPIAEIRFPEGAVFELSGTAHEQTGPGIQPRPAGMAQMPTDMLTADVPFIVRGNAHAVIALQSATIEAVHGSNGRVANVEHLGDTPVEPHLGVMIGFTDPRRRSAGHHVANRSDENPTWPLISRVNVSDGPMEGRFHVIARPKPIAGRSQHYRGELVVAVSAEL